jgi:hypothetical protein
MGRRRECRIVAFQIQCFSMQMAEKWCRKASLGHNMIIERSLPQAGSCGANQLSCRYEFAFISLIASPYDSQAKVATAPWKM